MRLISTTQAASMIGVTAQTIRNWIDCGHVKAKRVGNVFYVRAKTFENLCSFGGEDDFRSIKESLEKEKKAYLQERDEYRNMREDMRFEHERERYAHVAINSGITTNFFTTIVELLRINCNLGEREAEVLKRAIYGDSITYIAEKSGVTRERMRQIIEKAMRKCNDLSVLESKIKRLSELEDENFSLKLEINNLSRILTNLTNNVSDVEESELDRMIRLFNTKVIDCNFSVRVINGLLAGRVEIHFSFDKDKRESVVIVPECKTVGDICRLKREDLFKIRNFGKKSVDEIEDFLEVNNLSFGMDVDKYYTQKALSNE